MRLLIAEDDKALGLFLSRGLEADGHRVRVAYDGAAAVEAFRQEMPDLTILDLNMPVKDGEQVLEEMRVLDAESAGAGADRAAGSGHARTLPGPRRRRPDDQAIQPARAARALPCAAAPQAGDAGCNCAPAIWNWTGWTIRRAAAGTSIVLTNKEFALLEHLMLNRGQCVSRVELLDSVWKMEPAQTTNIVDVYVNYLRRKLEDPPPGRADPHRARAGIHGAAGG